MINSKRPCVNLELYAIITLTVTDFIEKMECINTLW